MTSSISQRQIVDHPTTMDDLKTYTGKLSEILHMFVGETNKEVQAYRAAITQIKQIISGQFVPSRDDLQHCNKLQTQWAVILPIADELKVLMTEEDFGTEMPKLLHELQTTIGHIESLHGKVIEDKLGGVKIEGTGLEKQIATVETLFPGLTLKLLTVIKKQVSEHLLKIKNQISSNPQKKDQIKDTVIETKVEAPVTVTSQETQKKDEAAQPVSAETTNLLIKTELEDLKPKEVEAKKTVATFVQNTPTPLTGELSLSPQTITSSAAETPLENAFMKSPIEEDTGVIVLNEPVQKSDVPNDTFIPPSTNKEDQQSNTEQKVEDLSTPQKKEEVTEESKPVESHSLQKKDSINNIHTSKDNLAKSEKVETAPPQNPTTAINLVKIPPKPKLAMRPGSAAGLVTAQDKPATVAHQAIPAQQELVTSPGNSRRVSKPAAVSSTLSKKISFFENKIADLASSSASELPPAKPKTPRTAGTTNVRGSNGSIHERSRSIAIDHTSEFGRKSTFIQKSRENLSSDLRRSNSLLLTRMNSSSLGNVAAPPVTILNNNSKQNSTHASLDGIAADQQSKETTSMEKQASESTSRKESTETRPLTPQNIELSTGTNAEVDVAPHGANSNDNQVESQNLANNDSKDGNEMPQEERKEDLINSDVSQNFHETAIASSNDTSDAAEKKVEASEIVGLRDNDEAAEDIAPLKPLSPKGDAAVISNHSDSQISEVPSSNQSAVIFALETPVEENHNPPPSVEETSLNNPKKESSWKESEADTSNSTGGTVPSPKPLEDKSLMQAVDSALDPFTGLKSDASVNASAVLVEPAPSKTESDVQLDNSVQSAREISPNSSENSPAERNYASLSDNQDVVSSGTNLDNHPSSLSATQILHVAAVSEPIPPMPEYGQVHHVQEAHTLFGMELKSLASQMDQPRDLLQKTFSQNYAQQQYAAANFGAQNQQYVTPNQYQVNRMVFRDSGSIRESVRSSGSKRNYVPEAYRPPTEEEDMNFLNSLPPQAGPEMILQAVNGWQLLPGATATRPFLRLDLSRPARIGRGNPARQAPNFVSMGASLVVSRQHLDIWEQNGLFYLADIGSNSGTWLNGQRLSDGGVPSLQFQLNRGDIIRLGADYRKGQDQDTEKDLRHKCIVMRVLPRPWNAALNAQPISTMQSSFSTARPMQLNNQTNEGQHKTVVYDDDNYPVHADAANPHYQAEAPPNYSSMEKLAITKPTALNVQTSPTLLDSPKSAATVLASASPNKKVNTPLKSAKSPTNFKAEAGVYKTESETTLMKTAPESTVLSRKDSWNDLVKTPILQSSTSVGPAMTGENGESVVRSKTSIRNLDSENATTGQTNEGPSNAKMPSEPKLQNKNLNGLNTSTNNMGLSTGSIQNLTYLDPDVADNPQAATTYQISHYYMMFTASTLPYKIKRVSIHNPLNIEDIPSSPTNSEDMSAQDVIGPEIITVNLKHWDKSKTRKFVLHDLRIPTRAETANPPIGTALEIVKDPTGTGVYKLILLTGEIQDAGFNGSTTSLESKNQPGSIMAFQVATLDHPSVLKSRISLCFQYLPDYKTDTQLIAPGPADVINSTPKSNSKDEKRFMDAPQNHLPFIAPAFTPSPDIFPSLNLIGDFQSISAIKGVSDKLDSSMTPDNNVLNPLSTNLESFDKSKLLAIVKRPQPSRSQRLIGEITGKQFLKKSFGETRWLIGTEILEESLWNEMESAPNASQGIEWMKFESRLPDNIKWTYRKEWWSLVLLGTLVYGILRE